jgi:hypothetical protein
MKTMRQTGLCLCLLLLTATAIFAQNSAGSLSGAVTDANGAAVSKAKVIAKQESTGLQFETVTTSEGLYAFSNLDVGSYTLMVEQAGFKKLTWPNVVISISNRTVADLKLEIGDVSQSVTVTAESPSLQTATTEIGVNFSPKLFKDAPIYAGAIRNAENFINFQPGVVNGAGAEGGISGGARRSKEILIDGANATNPESGGVAFNGLPSVESLGEFKLINNTFAAEYGRTGGGVESFITSSGGAQFHGNAFNFHSSSALSANPWATNAATVGPTPVRKTPYHGNEYGFALGGPVYLPKKIFGPVGGYNESKTRTFFFFTLDNFRRIDSSSAFYNLPTVKQRAGDFSELLPGRLIYDPLTGQPFPGNSIPQNRFSNVSKNILALVPLPTNPGLQQNYLGVLTSANKQDSWSLKINHNFTDKHLFNAYFTKQFIGGLIDGPLPAPLLGANRNAVSANRPIFARFNYDWIFTPTLNLHVTYGTTRLRQYFDNQSVGQGWPQRLGLRGVAEGETSAFPVVSFLNGGYQAYADTNGPKTKGTQFNYTEHVRADVGWIKGNFNWKFGMDHRWMKTTGEKLPTGGFDDAGVQGVFAFSNAQTALASNATGSGDAFASFLLGLVDTASRTFNANASSAKFGYNAWYAQTDWRVRPNLTLNFGLRYEIPIPRSTDPTAFTSFDPNLTDPRSGLKGALAYLGDCAGCIDSERFGAIDYSSIGPRLGLAWSVDQKTVLRLGYGIYYAAGNGLTGGFCLRCQNGYSNTAGLSRPSTTGAALQWDNGFAPPANFLTPPIISPSAGNAADDVWYIAPNSGTAPRFQNWSLSIQRELPWKFIAEAAYIGNRGTRQSAPHQPLNHLDPKHYQLGDLLNQRIDAPQVVAAGYKSPYANFIADWGNNATLARALRPYPHINGPINNHYNPIGNSWYDSLQLKLDRRFGSLFAEVNYTWSKALTNASGSQTSGDAANRNPKTDNPYNPNALDIEKSLQYIDIPHIFNVVAVYDLPFGKGKRFLNHGGFVDRVLGGWSVTFTGNYTSGALALLNAPLTYPNWGFEYGRKKVNLTGKPIRTGVSRQDLDPRAGLSPGSPTFNRANGKPWWTLDFFSIPGTYELGTAPNYITELRDPNAYNDNMGFIKRTRITETVNIEIRGEFFNIFNRTNFGIGGTPIRPNVLDTNPATGRFGVPAGPRSSARLGQVVAKINF